MKFLVVLGALVIQCAATKSWNTDSYSEETFSVFGWISYVKRLSLIALMVSGVILYYIPESRPHARRICYALVDITANALKSALSAGESEYMYEAIKTKYHQAKYEQSLLGLNRRSREGQENYSKKPKTDMDDDGLRESVKSREKKKVIKKQTKDYRQSRHRISNNISDPRVEIAKPAYFYTDKLDDVQKYVKTNLRGVNRINGSVENYALLISGSPLQMSMIDQKFEKDDVVLIEDPYCRVEYKECGTSIDRLSSKAGASGSEQEGTTSDHNNHTESQGLEKYLKTVDLSSAPEALYQKNSRYFNCTSLYQTNPCQLDGDCYGMNGCSISSGEINNRVILNTEPSDETKNVLKSSKSMVNPKTHEKIDENYTGHGRESRLLKSSNFSNDRRVNFQNEDKTALQKCEETVHTRDNTSRYVFKKKLTGHCCHDGSYFTDRGGEADDENSQQGRRMNSKHDLDGRPRRKQNLYNTNSDDSIFDYSDFYTKPILNNRFKPALLRAVNWIFGGCPEAKRRAAAKCNEVGKEEIQGFTDEWLL
ncbi:PREDICTED: uncharacterized protein LOC107193878 [Dufourea novaeangliae]|uniref:uncharacterized protein LOC107193878 n=1 Tax=Dufourea novaeangliae TaxID=178035 RepID=UPI000767AAED|nr:PREDICTED: uncharacterized protein LOC107193878 [Dufourea novaeangliae]